MGNCDRQIFLQNDRHRNFNRMNDYVVCSDYLHIVNVHILDSISKTFNRNLRFLSDNSLFSNFYWNFDCADFCVFSQNLFNHFLFRFHIDINNSFNRHFHNFLYKARLLYNALNRWHLFWYLNEFLHNFLYYLGYLNYLFDYSWNNYYFLNNFLNFNTFWYLNYFFNNFLYNLDLSFYSVIVYWKRHR